MRIGLLGGSFDPPHSTHIEIAKLALSKFNLDKIVFVPSKIPPHRSKVIASDEHRVKMLNLCFDNFASQKDEKSKFEISNIELDRKDTSYTYFTLKSFHENGYEGKELNKENLFLIIGYDNFLIFEKWYRYEDILKMANVVVFSRDLGQVEDPEKQLKEQNSNLNFTFVNDILSDLSSTRVRLLIDKYYVNVKDEQTISELNKTLSQDVLNYIIANQLYRS